MSNILIFGNSGSGKSTLAKELCSSGTLAHLDLDTLAWKPVTPPERMPLEDSAKKIDDFINSTQNWVIEGCYSDLLQMVISKSTEVIFMNLPVETCKINARNRPWEPHKYKSREAQDANLEMLLDWIAQYTERDDGFSLASHERLYKNFRGKKKMYVSNQRNT